MATETQPIENGIGEKKVDREDSYDSEMTKTNHDGAVPATTGKTKHSASGIELVPRPSDDERDPLNWPMSKKITLYGILCFGTFVSIASAVANVLAVPVQAKDWGVPAETATYSVSAVLGGITIGPIILVAAVRAVGVMSCCFWSEVLVVVTSIWSAVSTGPGHFQSFVASRVINGLFTATIQVFSTGVIAQIFFVHQRGKALAVYSTIYMIATLAGPTFSGYIVQYVEWPVCFWWTVGANGLVAVLLFLFGDDTTWDRENDRPQSQHELPKTWAGKRFALFFPGHRVVAPGVGQNIKTSYIAFVKIFFSPIVILAGLFTLITYAWFIMAGVQIPVILQEPLMAKGYGFTPLETSNFYFSAWIGAALGIAYGILLNDRLPLWLQKSRGGIWHPEFRLHTAWFPGLIVLPIGAGIFGASVAMHYQWPVLAVAEAMIVFGSTSCLTPPVNYVIEVFKSHPQEVGTALNVWRIAFSVGIQFYYTSWTMATGVTWTWGIAAFIVIFGCMVVGVLAWKGSVLRRYSLLPDEAVADEEEAQKNAQNGKA